MKKIFMALTLGLAALTVSAKDIKEVTYTPQPRMTCPNCEKKIKGNLRFEKGIKKIETNLEAQTITITYDADKTSEKKLEEALSKLQYTVTKK